MRLSKRTYSMVNSVLASLLILSSFAVSIISAQDVNAATDYGNLLQYEWPQIHGDPAFTRFSAGPAPEAPDILWKTTINGLESYVVAFNGKVFATTATNVIALDKDTGAIVWNTTLPSSQRWPAVYKIDGTHLVTGKYCLNIENGEILWTSNEFSASVAFFATGVYSPEEKVFYNKGLASIEAWNFSDPSEPPTLAWETYIPGGGASGSGVHYGDGKVFVGSYDAHQMVLDAKTGDVLWDTETKGLMVFSGSYYQGKFLRGGELDNTFYCFDAELGETLWEFNPGTQFGFWGVGNAAAYGKVYGGNSDGYFYALDVNNGHPVWKYKGSGNLFIPGYPVVADGKVYATTGQGVAADPYTGELSESEFVCLDAFTGDLLWKLPIEAHAPRESVAIAYGNLYLIPTYTKGRMDIYETTDEIWAIGSKSWPMWRNDPEHSGTGQSGPTNLTLRWKFTTNGGVVSSPSVVDGRVYVGSNDKNIYSIDARSGRLVWKFMTGARIKSSPAVVDGKVYIGPDDGYVYCLDAHKGSIVWQRYAGGYIEPHFAAVSRLRSSPAVVGGRVYVGSLDTNVYCLDAGFGNIIWTYKTEGYITSSPAVVDGAVYIASQESSSVGLYKLDAYNGSRIWKLEIPYQLTAERGTDMHASPTVADGMVFVATNKFDYFGINATTGNIEWSYRAIFENFLVGSITYHEGKLFLIDQFFIVCVDAKNGVALWNSWIGSELYASPTYADGKIYVAADRRFIYVLNATNGDRLSHFETDSNLWSSPSLYEGMLYLGSMDWNVYCLVDAIFPITSTSIVANLSKDTVNQTSAESITVTGEIKPEIAHILITVTFIKPDQTTVERVVQANEKGAFTVSYTPDTVGDWTITARYSGAEYSSRIYTAAYSADLPLKVVGSGEQTQPSPGQPNSQEEQSPSEKSGSGITIEYLYGGAIAVIIIVVAISAYLLMKRRKNIEAQYKPTKLENSDT